ncbi:HlyC/CorC family transporter [candidate division KSB1 bacterium]|nr:HlyC/CorC family transporter [candidate division KSB1 bacterium]
MIWIWLSLLLLLSAFFSATEISFLAADRYRIKIWERKQRRGAKLIGRFLQRPDNFLSTILVGNNIALVAFSSLATITMKVWGLSEGLILVLVSCFILVVGEIIPKSLFREMADRALLGLVFPFWVVYAVLFPVVKVTASISRRLSGLFNLDRDMRNTVFTRRDLKYVFQAAREGGGLGKQEEKIISRVLGLAGMSVRDIMTPRAEIVSLDLETPLSQVKMTFLQSGYTKLPVYERDIDHIRGMVFAKDMFKGPVQLNEIMRGVKFVSGFKSIGLLFREMRKSRSTVVIAVDEYGGTAGLVTLEDVLEVLFGTIEDEFDRVYKGYWKIKEGKVVVSARMRVQDVHSQLGISLPHGNYRTLSGFITSQLGEIPRTKQRITWENYQFTTLKTSERRPQIILITRVKNDKKS